MTSRDVTLLNSLVDYVEDIKPYHTKVKQFLSELFFNDNFNVNVTDSLGWTFYHQNQWSGDDVNGYQLQRMCEGLDSDVTFKIPAAIWPRFSIDDTSGQTPPGDDPSTWGGRTTHEPGTITTTSSHQVGSDFVDGDPTKFRVGFHQGSRVYVDSVVQIYDVDYFVDKSRGFIKFVVAPALTAQIEIQLFKTDRLFVAFNYPFDYEINRDYDMFGFDMLPYDSDESTVTNDADSWTVVIDSTQPLGYWPTMFYNAYPLNQAKANLVVDSVSGDNGDVWRITAIGPWSFKVQKNLTGQIWYAYFKTPFDNGEISFTVDKVWSDYYLVPDDNTYNVDSVDETDFLVDLSATTEHGTKTQRVILVYNGAPVCEGCSEFIVDALTDPVTTALKAYSPIVETISVWGDIPARLLTLPKGSMLVIGGTDDYLFEWAAGGSQEMTPYSVTAIQDWVRNGGRYLGICGGAIVAQAIYTDPTDVTFNALNLVPAVIYNFDNDDGDEHLEPIRSNDGVIYDIYFQLGNYFTIQPSVEYFDVIGTYMPTTSPLVHGAEIATMEYTYGAGKVGISGAHYEATADFWDETPEGFVAHTELLEQLVADLLSDRVLVNRVLPSVIPPTVTIPKDPHRPMEFVMKSVTVEGGYDYLTYDEQGYDEPSASFTPGFTIGKVKQITETTLVGDAEYYAFVLDTTPARGTFVELKIEQNGQLNPWVHTSVTDDMYLRVSWPTGTSIDTINSGAPNVYAPGHTRITHNVSITGLVYSESQNIDELIIHHTHDIAPTSVVVEHNGVVIAMPVSTISGYVEGSMLSPDSIGVDANRVIINLSSPMTIKVTLTF